MATTITTYKNRRTARRVAQPNVFQLGCNYTNQTVPVGYAKFLLNYDYTDDGLVLRPRMGIENDKVLEHSDVSTESTMVGTLGDAHIDGLLYFKDKDEDDTLTELIFSLGLPYNYGNTEHNIPQDSYFIPNINLTKDGVVNKNSPGWGVVLDRRDTTVFARTPYKLAKYKTGTDAEDTIGLVRSKTFSNLNIFGITTNDTDTLQISRPVICIFDGAVYMISTSAFEDTENTFTCADPKFKLSRLIISEDAESNFLITRQPVEVKEPTLSEAASTGFNMLLDNPYAFENRQGATEIYGLFAYSPAPEGSESPLGEVLFTANKGEVIRFNAVYGYEEGSEYEVRWEVKYAGDETFTVLKDWTAVTVGTDKYIYYDYTPTASNFTMLVLFRKKGDNADVQQGILPNFELGVESLKNAGTETFDLTTATGMFTYNKMLGLYGVKGAETSLFFSDIENPGYFPFPHNTDTFDEYILKVINYLDSLLIITTNSIYTITGSGLPSSFVKKKIVTNLNITELDADLIKVIKDQVFFKADNTFFVLKPNSYTGNATDLRAFEVSKAINTYLQDFKTNTLAVFNKVYPIRMTEPDLKTNPNAIDLWQYTDLVIKNYNQHVIDGRLNITINLDVICDMQIQQETKYLVNNADLIIVYDTLTKQWYFHIQSIGDACSLRHRRIDSQELLTFTNKIVDDKHYLFINKYVLDPKDSYNYIIEDKTYTEEAYFPNWQYIDTGILDFTNTYYKRLRELQFTINNIARQNIKMYTTIYADGKNVIDTTAYDIEHIQDPESPDYGHIYISATDTPNLSFPSTTFLDGWELDESKFPDLNLIRVHLLLYGKARFISGEFINRNELLYEISDILWVYRIMNAR